LKELMRFDRANEADLATTSRIKEAAGASQDVLPPHAKEKTQMKDEPRSGEVLRSMVLKMVLV
jgi:hypothetical protein